jgi:hypothetical protein
MITEVVKPHTIVAPILYLCVHKKMFEYANNGKIIDNIRAKRIIGSLMHAPKKLHYLVMREMEQFGLIKIEGFKKVHQLKLLGAPFDFENNCSKLYKHLEMF